MEDDHCFEVHPRSITSIYAVAVMLRNALRVSEFWLPIDRIVEFEMPKVWDDFSFVVKELDELGDDHGRTYPDRNSIWLRSDVYQGVRDGKGRDRFTLAHEVGHLLLHQQPVAFARRLVLVREVPQERNPEWQADMFASFFLIPLDAFKKLRTNGEIAKACGVTETAVRQIREVYKEMGIYA